MSMSPTIFLFISAALSNLLYEVKASTSINWVVTTESKGQLLSTQDAALAFSGIQDLPTVPLNIFLASDTKYQTMFGFGSSLEASTCYNMNLLGPEERDVLMRKLFSTSDGIGFNLMRLTVGTSDYCLPPFYSYNDRPAGRADPTLEYFNTFWDDSYIAPMIQEALVKSRSYMEDDLRAAQDGLLFFASPWSGPSWMKSTGSLIGGELLDQYMPQYAQYLSKFISAYSSQYDIDIYAVTPQNEPNVIRSDYPSSFLSPEKEAELIANYLGPEMDKLGVKIWGYDDNWDTLSFPEHILNNSDAAKYIQGTGFHGYIGQPTEMTTLHDQFPDKDIFFTEKSMYGIKGAAEIVAIFRNWARSYNAWITMLDTNFQPKTGEADSIPTMVQLDVTSQPYSVIYNLEYYIYGQFSKFIRRGAVRISSEDSAVGTSSISHVAFVNDASISGVNTTVLVIVNDGESTTVQIRMNAVGANVILPARSISTLTWENSLITEIIETNIIT